MLEVLATLVLILASAYLAIYIVVNFCDVRKLLYPYEGRFEKSDSCDLYDSDVDFYI